MTYKSILKDFEEIKNLSEAGLDFEEKIDLLIQEAQRDIYNGEFFEFVADTADPFDNADCLDEASIEPHRDFIELVAHAEELYIERKAEEFVDSYWRD